MMIESMKTTFYPDTKSYETEIQTGNNEIFEEDVKGLFNMFGDCQVQQHEVNWSIVQGRDFGFLDIWLWYVEGD